MWLSEWAIGMTAMKMLEMFVSYSENPAEESGTLVSHDYGSRGST
jgi:hypothetical protein